MRKNGNLIRRFITLTVVPVSILCLVASLLVSMVIHKHMEQQLNIYGNFIAEQLSIATTQHLIGRDSLSLSVVLSDFINASPVIYASVYDTENRLVGKAGSENHASYNSVFRSEITFQREFLGYIEIRIGKDIIRDSAKDGVFYVLVSAFLVLGISGFLQFTRADKMIWIFFASLMEKYSGSTGHNPLPETSLPENNKILDIKEESDRIQFLLVIKFTNQHREKDMHHLIQLLEQLYDTRVLAYQTGEFCIGSKSSQCLTDLVCIASLLKKIASQQFPALEIKFGIHAGRHGKIDLLKKETSYIASISRGEILISKATSELMQLPEDIFFNIWHDSAVSDNEVLVLHSMSMEKTALLDRQAQLVIKQFNQQK